MIKKGVAILLALGMIMPFSGYHEISFANEVQAVQQPVENTKSILETAVDNIEGMESAQEANALASLSKEDKYKALYKDKLYKMMRLHWDFFVLRAPDQSEPMINFVYKAQKLMDRAQELKDEISELEPDESQKASKEYLEKSSEELFMCCDHLKMYYQYILWGNESFQKRLQGFITNRMKTYDENFRSAYEYYMTAGNGVAKKEVMPSEDRVLIWIKKNLKKLEEISEDMDSMYEDIEYHDETYTDDLAGEIGERLERVNFADVDIDRHHELVKDVEEAIYMAEKSLKYLKEYEWDVWEDENTLKRYKDADDGKYLSKHIELDSQLRRIRTSVEEIDLEQFVNPKKSFVFSFEEIEKQEFQQANARGYVTLAEYKNALKSEREAKRKSKIVQEIKRLEIANGKPAKDAGIEAERLYGEWMAGRIDFTKQQASQNRDKTFFMNQARLQLQGNPLYKGDAFLVNRISILQSQAYDEVWRLSALPNADRFKLQELYDEYSNDFVSIVLAYKIETGSY